MTGSLPTLYHSTTKSRFESIWERGLLPGTGPGSMGMSWPSRPGYVYLTSANAVHFAVAAWHASGARLNEQMLVVEVDGSMLDPSLVYPDDEYIASRLGLTGEDYKQHATRDDCDPKCRQEDWMECLRELRSIAYAGIVQPSAIRRYAIINGHAITQTPLAKANAHASVYANAIGGDLATALSRYIFDGDADAFMKARTTFLREQYPDDDAEAEAKKDVRALSLPRYVTVVQNQPGASFPGDSTVVTTRTPEQLPVKDQSS